MNDSEDFDLRKEVVIFSPGRFTLGAIVASPGVMTTLTRADIARALSRHACCDWGDVDEHDWEANQDAIEQGGRILSAYHSEASGERFWVITEADRAFTTVLLPSEY